MSNTIFVPMRRNIPHAALVVLFFLVSCGNRVNPAPKPQAPPPFEFLGAWGDKGQGPGKLDAPVSFAADALNHIFFVDPGANFIHKFESTGTPLLSFEDTRVRHAAGIAVDSGGAIYVADAQRGNILIFFPDGTFLQSWHSPVQRHFSGSLGISTDEQGALYMPDPAHARVLKYNNRGHLVKSWPAPQKALSADELPSWVSAEPDNTVFVAYFKTGRIEKFSSDGSWMTTWSAVNTPPGEPSPLSGFAVSGDFVFTMAASSTEIRIWTVDGKPKLDADLATSLGKIVAPQLVVTRNEELLVFDPAAPKVFRFRLHLESKEPI
jgi:hypothetical protein